MVSLSSSAIGSERRILAELPGPKSQALHARRDEWVSSALSDGFPVYIERANGAILRDVDGNDLLDFGSGIAVTSIGHANPDLIDAVRSQVAAFTHTCFLVSPYENYIDVCEELAALTPGTHSKRSVLVNSGSEAVENAIKIARHATGRQAVIVFDNAYHGRTNLTMALTARSMPYKDGFGPFAPEIYRVPMSYPYRDGLSGPDAARRAIESIESQVGARNVAALIIEPIQGEGGFIVPAEGFLPALREWTSHHGVVFIADEIQSGFCRTGDWFAVDHEGVVPDLVTMAKGLAGGMPLAAVTGKTELMNAVHKGGLGGTYSGNPVAVAAALATLHAMKTQHLTERALHIGDVLTTALRSLQEKSSIVGDVRGRGAMIAVEFVLPDTVNPNPDALRSIVQFCNRDGLIVLTCGAFGNVLRLLPPLTITDAQLRDGLEVLSTAVRGVS
jgi:4-aminobutyrate aminotransferase/(S)-3-amino-2-methylpropionate transaminase